MTCSHTSTVSWEREWAFTDTLPLISVYENLSFEMLEPLLPAIYQATMESAPSGIMLADGVRTAGLKLMAKHRLEEGIAACVHYVRHMKQHGSQQRVPEVLEILLGYGAHAQAVVPELLRIADYFDNEEQNLPKNLSRQKAEAVGAAVRAIHDARERPRAHPHPVARHEATVLTFLRFDGGAVVRCGLRRPRWRCGAGGALPPAVPERTRLPEVGRGTAAAVGLDASVSMLLRCARERCSRRDNSWSTQPEEGPGWRPLIGNR